jgi:hypothetical protein
LVSFLLLSFFLSFFLSSSFFFFLSLILHFFILFFSSCFFFFFVFPFVSRHELAQLPPALQVVCPLAFGLSTILNMMWFRKIVRGAWKVLKEGGKGRKQDKKLS